jgi:hypothetical protein
VCNEESAEKPAVEIWGVERVRKVDLLRELGALYKPPMDRPVLVEVPKMNYLAVDGEGDPNTSVEYRDSIQALYSASYALKFMVKRGRDAIDYRVMPLEGLWWADDMNSFAEGKKGDWKWTSMIAQPDLITGELVEAAIVKLKEKGLPALQKVRYETFDEGLSAQILYVGPFSEEGSTIRKLHDFIEEGGHIRRGKHHEIYMSDVRRVAPGKLKTIIRQPVG